MGGSPYRSLVTALILGIIPSFLFFGVRNSASVNGVVTSSSRINILGLILGGIGLGLAIRFILRPPPNRDNGAMLVAILAAAVCVAQLLNSIGLIDLNF